MCVDVFWADRDREMSETKPSINMHIPVADSAPNVLCRILLFLLYLLDSVIDRINPDACVNSSASEMGIPWAVCFRQRSASPTVVSLLPPQRQDFPTRTLQLRPPRR